MQIDPWKASRSVRWRVSPPLVPSLLSITERMNENPVTTSKVTYQLENAKKEGRKRWFGASALIHHS